LAFCQALNELGEQQNLPVELVVGSVSKISISIPWITLMRDSSTVEVDGLNLVIQPKRRADNGEHPKVKS
jgi:autophagy-related protein 2